MYQNCLEYRHTRCSWRRCCWICKVQKTSAILVADSRSSERSADSRSSERSAASINRPPFDIPRNFGSVRTIGTFTCRAANSCINEPNSCIKYPCVTHCKCFRICTPFDPRGNIPSRICKIKQCTIKPFPVPFEQSKLLEFFANICSIGTALLPITSSDCPGSVVDPCKCLRFDYSTCKSDSDCPGSVVDPCKCLRFRNAAETPCDTQCGTKTDAVWINIGGRDDGE